ncbi:conserved hypothetical protein [Shewanella sediminis HAW-EB3]|uniref:Uncharacterized protein n=1 Tax=Shewanella sediminis (strain HAW-EB3) TaxID=425104 RepID=A8FSG1_SHESH|nr:hypothetical protein [Shewanella sediminis]ABV35784.1 conserved hypothetical protein [Shewanella sediminis HAW-EB3]
MIAKSVYEALPFSYISIGSACILMLEQKAAIFFAMVVFALGAKIYNMRSQNRRTDPVRKRKPGKIPASLYNFVPFIYLFTATVVFKLYPTKFGAMIGTGLMVYSLYILIQRSSNRRHSLSNSQCYPNM